MGTNRFVTPSIFLSLAAGAFGWGGCQEPAPRATADESSQAGATAADRSPKIAPKIANAMKAVTTQAPPVSGGFEPPPNGIVDPGQAQLEVPAGAAPVLVMGATGATPRVQLGASPGANKATLQLQVRLGGSVMPTVELAVAQVPLPEKAGEAATPPARSDFILSKAELAAQQPGRLPPGAADTISRLAGARIRLTDGARGTAIELPKEKDDLRPLAVAAADSLSTLSVVLPSQPVGNGAYWMVKSRETFNEAQVLSYRMFRVMGVQGQKVELTVDAKRYLTEARLPLAGLPPHRVQEWRSEGKGSVVFQAGQGLPASAELEESFLAIVVPSQGQSQAIPIQGEVKASFTLSLASDE